MLSKCIGLYKFWIFLFITYITSVVGVKYSGDESVEEGKAFHIECEMEDEDNLFWTKDGIRLIDDDDYIISDRIVGKKVISEISVGKAEEEHEGYYRCDSLSRDFHYLKVSNEHGDDDDDEEDEEKPWSKLEIGKKLELSCELGSDIDDLDIKWYKNGEEIENEGDVLVIEDAKVEDAGQYYCKVTSIPDGRKVTYLGQFFEVYSPPDIDPFPPTASFFLNSKELVLDCDVIGGYPEAKIAWFIGNEAIESIQKSDDRLQTIPNMKYPNGKLYISPISHNDKNFYTCVAENPVGRGESSVYVTIRAIESIQLPSSTTFVKKGDKFTVTCKVPFGGLHLWYKDGRPISPNSINNYHLEQEPQPNSNEDKENRKFYMLMKLTVERADVIHSGEYKCSSYSPHSQRIVVLSENMIETNDNGEGLLLSLNKELVLQCKTAECEQCNVKWFKDGEHINKSDARIQIYDGNNSLVIESAKEKDAGEYICKVDRKILGEDINATINVRTKIQLESFDKSINLVEGDKLTLHCVVKSGSPTPRIIWYKDNHVLNDSSNHIKFKDDEDREIKNAILIIEELEFSDRAYYTCEAYNGISSSNTTTLVRVKDKLAALWPFLGICAEVGILCTIIFVYEKKKVKENEESDMDKTTENKNVPSRGQNPDVRQRR